MTRGRRLLLVAGALLALLVIALLVGRSDLAELKARASELDLRWAVVAALLAVASYGCIAGTQGALLAVLGHRVPAWFFVRASTISVVVARTLRSGGTSGLAFLALVLARRGVPVEATLSMGVVNALLNACVATALLLFGFLLLLLQPQHASRGAMTAYAIGAATLLLVLSCGWAFLAHARLRARVLRRAAWVAERAGRVLRREGWGERLATSGERVGEAARRLLGDPARAWRAWAWSLARLVASLLSLAACGAACDVSLSPPALLLAFTAMKLAGSLAFVPAGLGVVDGALVGMLVLLGVEYEAALLVAALHRVAYHVVPAAVALAVAGPLLWEATHEAPP